MVALLSVFAIVLVSLVITRVATVLLVITGMSREAARFQARSALSGVGFTTNEAEAVVSHPVRRRIVLALMLLGSAGLITAIASLIVSFGGSTTGEGLLRILVLIAGLALILLLARSRWFDRRLERLVGDVLRARGITVRDYASLLELSGDYVVVGKHVDADDWMAGRTLGELKLREEGVIALGLHPAGGGYRGVPGFETRVEPGDGLVLYGRRGRLEELDERHRGVAGERAHAAASADERAREAARPPEDDDEATMEVREPADGRDH